MQKEAADNLSIRLGCFVAHNQRFARNNDVEVGNIVLVREASPLSEIVKEVGLRAFAD